MSTIHRLLLPICFLAALLTACDDYTCQEAQEAIELNTKRYTDALDEGGDGMAECESLRESLVALITDSTCPGDVKDDAQNLLNALDCN